MYVVLPFNYIWMKNVGNRDQVKTLKITNKRFVQVLNMAEVNILPGFRFPPIPIILDADFSFKGLMFLQAKKGPSIVTRGRYLGVIFLTYSEVFLHRVI